MALPRYENCANITCTSDHSRWLGDTCTPFGTAPMDPSTTYRCVEQQYGEAHFGKSVPEIRRNTVVGGVFVIRNILLAKSHDEAWFSPWSRWSALTVNTPPTTVKALGCCPASQANVVETLGGEGNSKCQYRQSVQDLFKLASTAPGNRSSVSNIRVRSLLRGNQMRQLHELRDGRFH